MAAAPMEELELLIIGKSGNGKSATGNSILGRDALETCCDSTTGVGLSQYGYARFENQGSVKIVKVIDTPGIFQTGYSAKNCRSGKVSKEFCSAVCQCPNGFHALLLVFKFGERFTHEDECLIETFKLFFGEDFIRRFCILIFTCGDHFKQQVGREMSFMKWLQNQTGPLGQLIEECGYRCVLFENLTDLDEQKQLQRKQLFFIVESVVKSECRFENEISRKVRTTQNSIAENKKALTFQNQIQRKIYLIQDSLNWVKNSLHDAVLPVALEQLHRDIDDLKTEIAKEGKSFQKVLKPLSEAVEALEKDVVTEVENLRARQEQGLAMTIFVHHAKRFQTCLKDGTKPEEMDTLMKTMVKFVGNIQSRNTSEKK